MTVTYVQCIIIGPMSGTVAQHLPNAGPANVMGYGCGWQLVICEWVGGGGGD